MTGDNTTPPGGAGSPEDGAATALRGAFGPGEVVFWTLNLPERRLTLMTATQGQSVEMDTAQAYALIHPEDLPGIQQASQAAALDLSPLNQEVRVCTPDGQLHWVYVAGRLTPGVPHQLSGIARPITEVHQVIGQLQEREAQLRAVVDLGRIGIFIQDLDERLVLVNDVLQKVGGFRREGHGLKGSRLADILTRSELLQVREASRHTLETHQRQEVVWTFRNRPGAAGASRLCFEVHLEPYWQGGQVAGVVGYMQDVTRQRQEAQTLSELTQRLELKVAERTHDLQELNARLLHTSLHDPLTGLPNRRSLTARLRDCLHRLGERCTFALLFVDLDNFKSVNDTLGHAAGDALLLQVSARLAALPLGRSMVARQSGDEFVVLIEDITDVQQALRLAEQVAALFQSPFCVGGRDLLIQASIGLTLAGGRDHDPAQPGPGQDHGASADLGPEELLQQADIAMYRAKTSGRGQVEVFTPELQVRRRALAGLQQDLRHALRRGEFRVAFQPVVALPECHLAGFEALVRWQHPEHGLIAPGEFIPIAEQQLLIAEIDALVLRLACRAAAPALRAGKRFRLSVNFSTVSMQQPDLVEQILTILAEEQYPASNLVIEVTESILVQDFPQVSSVLWQLRDQGILVALDDFGTGYSSFGYLHRLPFTQLKIDRSFIGALDHAPAVLHSVTELAARLDLAVVAEGVETERQLQQLLKLNCTFAQGHLFGSALEEAEMLGLLETAPLWRAPDPRRATVSEPRQP